MRFSKKGRRKKIHRGIRSKIKGSASTPRLSIFRSNKTIYGQLIDDVNGVTLASASSDAKASGNKTDAAKVVGKEIAEKAKSHGIETVVFDRGGYLYHGRVKALAEGAREGGLKF